MTPELFRKLAALNLSHEQMAGVLEIMEGEAETRRSKARARVQKWRNKKNEKRSNTLRNVTEHNIEGGNVSSGLARVEDSSSKEVDTGQNNTPSLRSGAETDARTRLFRDGLSTLVEITGSTPTRMRSLLGKWLRDTNDDALRVFNVILKAAQDRPAEPVAWIERHFRASTGPPKSMTHKLLAATTKSTEQLLNDYHAKYEDAPDASYAGRGQEVIAAVTRAVSVTGR